MSRRALLLAVLAGVSATSVRAQCVQSKSADLPLAVNDDAERYARVRQVAGDAPLYPWSIRSFGWREACALSVLPANDPWHGTASATAFVVGPFRLVALPTSVEVVNNSAFPYGSNDGAVWAGRGVTTSMSTGFAAALGPLSLVIEPLAFRSENADFTMRDNGMSGDQAYGDAFAPGTIDQPQRFGSRAYERLSPGNSTVRLDVFGVAAGFSSASQHWGPARDNPLLLGNNAEGYPHVFLGTSAPVSIGVARVHTRLHWGRLGASPFGPVPSGYRLATGIAFAVIPRGLPGLELGFGRYFHLRWSDSVLTSANLTRPFIGLVRSTRITASDPYGAEPDNQLASIFARWVFPESGLEVYGEIGKDDYNSTTRDLLMEPDHISAYVLGVQRVVRRADRGYLVLRGEVLNARITSLNLNRPEVPLYVHSPVYEGHTHLGQVLGAPGGNGGGSAEFAVDRYDSSGRTTVAWTRLLRHEYIDGNTGMPVPTRADLLEVLSLSGRRLCGRTAVTYEATTVTELNRFFQGDAFNLRLSFGLARTW